MKQKIQFFTEAVETLVVVTKKHNLRETREAIISGAEVIGESRVQDAKEKYPELQDLDFQMHMIGHLQTNKAADAAKIFDMIQSVDSLRLAEILNTEARKIGKAQKILLQLNLTQEEGKSGFGEQEFVDVFGQIRDLKNIEIQGLMCMGKQDDPEMTRSVFRRLRELVDSYDLKYCSMGMSDDWQIALEEGSNMLRIGSAIFG